MRRPRVRASPLTRSRCPRSPACQLGHASSTWTWTWRRAAFSACFELPQSSRPSGWASQSCPLFRPSLDLTPPRLPSLLSRSCCDGDHTRARTFMRRNTWPHRDAHAVAVQAPVVFCTCAAGRSRQQVRKHLVQVEMVLLEEGQGSFARKAHHLHQGRDEGFAQVQLWSRRSSRADATGRGRRRRDRGILKQPVHLLAPCRQVHLRQRRGRVVVIIARPAQFWDAHERRKPAGLGAGRGRGGGGWGGEEATRRAGGVDRERVPLSDPGGHEAPRAGPKYHTVRGRRRSDAQRRGTVGWSTAPARSSRVGCTASPVTA